MNVERIPESALPAMCRLGSKFPMSIDVMQHPLASIVHPALLEGDSKSKPRRCVSLEYSGICNLWNLLRTTLGFTYDLLYP